MILAGITTDVCKSFSHSVIAIDTAPNSKGLTVHIGTTFCALSLREAGYSVWANVEASGTTTELIRDVSNDRMARAGVQIVSLFSIVCDLMRDWRATPGIDAVYPYLAQYYPVYGRVAAAHGAAARNGTISNAEELLLAPLPRGV